MGRCERTGANEHMKIIQQISKYDSSLRTVELETIYDDEILLTIKQDNFNFSTKVSKELLKEFVEKL